MSDPRDPVPDESRLAVEHLQSLLRLAKKLELAHHYHSIIGALASEIELVIGYRSCWVYLFDEDPYVARLLTASEEVGISDKLPTLNFENDAFLREIRQADHIVVVEDARTDPRTDKDIVAMLGNRSIINVPVRLAGKTLGAIGTGSFGDEGVHLPSAGQLDYLSSMASHTAVALDRIRLFEERLAAEKEKRLMQDQIAHVQRLESLGVLAGGIAHDFNNILTAILGNAALAEGKLTPGSPAQKHLRHITMAGKRATDLCLQMLAYAGHQTIQPAAIDLSRLIHEMGTLLSVSIGKSTKIDYRLQRPLPSMLGDVAQIQQIMMNLITNANEAIGGRTGTISISTGHIRADKRYLEQLSLANDATEGDYVYFEVGDTGCGMDEETRQHLFEPFFTTKFTGRGLGMSAVLGIIKAHNGALNLYSEPDVGTSFKVLFPAVDIPAQAAPEEPSGAMPEVHGHILVVDDEAMVRDTTVMLLEDMGFDVLAAESGREALDTLKRRPGDIVLVVLDMTMPDMDGAETLEGIRTIAPELPVIVASGYSQQDNARRFVRQQPEGFIQKPFHPDALKRLLQTILSRPE